MNRKVSNGRTIALDIVKTRKKGELPSSTGHITGTDLERRMGSESLSPPSETLLIATDCRHNERVWPKHSSRKLSLHLFWRGLDVESGRVRFSCPSICGIADHASSVRGRQNEEMPNPRSYLFDIDSRFMSYFKDIKDFEEEGLMVIADNRPASKIRGTDLPSAQAMLPEEEIRNTKSTCVNMVFSVRSG